MAQHTHSIPLTIDYVEISVTDMAAARDFYASAFGWSFTDYGPEYSGIRTAAEAASEADEAGGLLLADRVMPGGPLVLLYSDDLDATEKAVTAAGGTIVNGPYDFPGRRRFHFTDPSGNELGVWSAPSVTADFLAERDQGEQVRDAL